MAKMSGGEALAKSLANEGVEVVFGIPGIQIYGIVAGLRDEPSIRMISTRHEQATTYMADGYALASGKLGVALVVPGAGLYNAAAGLTNAYSRSTPVLLIAGQIPRGAIGKGLGAVHEIEDQPGAVRGVTKWQRLAMRPREIPVRYSKRSGRCARVVLAQSWLRYLRRQGCSKRRSYCETLLAFHELCQVLKTSAKPLKSSRSLASY